VSTQSSQLSHLFNQGSNAVEVVRGEPDAFAKLVALVEQRSPAEDRDAMLAPLRSGKYSVSYAIVTHKAADQKSANLPLFSRVSLRRNLRALQVMGVPANFSYVADQSVAAAGKKKRRKKKAPANPEEGGDD